MQKFTNTLILGLIFFFYTLIFSWGLLAHTTKASAGVPQIVLYQGRLTDSGGNALGGTGASYYFKFSLWDSVSGGTKVWPVGTPGVTTLTVKQGYFNVDIGDTTNGYPDALTYNWSTNSKVYLQIEVSSDNVTYETLSPRSLVTSAAFAQTASQVSGTDASSFGTTTPLVDSIVTAQSTSASKTALSLIGYSGQTVNIFDIINSASQSLFTVTGSGNVGVGTSSPIGSFSLISTSAAKPIFTIHSIANQAANLVDMYDASGAKAISFFATTTGSGNGVTLTSNTITTQGASIYTKDDGTHIHPDLYLTAGSGRIYFGDSSNTAYSLNFTNVGRFEAVPSSVSQNATVQTGCGTYKGTTCSIIGNSGGSYPLAFAAKYFTNQYNNGGFYFYSPIDNLSNNYSGSNAAYEMDTASSSANFSKYLHTSWQAAGVNLMTLSNTGKLNIGSASPATSTNPTLSVTSLPNVDPLDIASSSNTSLFHVLANGNVGIGTNNPGSRFSLGAYSTGISLPVYSSNDQAYITYGQVQNFPYNMAYQRVLDIVSGGAGTNAGGAIRLITRPSSSAAAVTAMYLGGDGRIGMGTLYPWARVTVQNTFGSTTSLLDIATTTSSGGATSSIFMVSANGNVGIGTTSPSAQLHTTGTVRFANFGAGTLTTDANGNLSVSSDERLKNIQGFFTTGLSAIESLRPISFKWKPETGLDTVNTYTGFSAQNVQIAIPEAVSKDKHGNLTLQDRPILAALVNAIKEIGLSIDHISNGITYLKDIVIEKLTIGSAGAPAGITLYDEVTGTPYCLKVRNGQTVTEQGVCGVVVSTPVAPVVTTDVVVTTEVSSSTPDTIASSTPPASSEVTISVDVATTTTDDLGDTTTTTQ